MTVLWTASYFQLTRLFLFLNTRALAVKHISKVIEAYVSIKSTNGKKLYTCMPLLVPICLTSDYNPHFTHCILSLPKCQVSSLEDVTFCHSVFFPKAISLWEYPSKLILFSVINLQGHKYKDRKNKIARHSLLSVWKALKLQHYVVIYKTLHHLKINS